jgi:hypothetical protein
VVAASNIENLYEPDNHFQRHPVALAAFARAGGSLAGRSVITDIVTAAHGPALRGNGVSVAVALSFCGIQTPPPAVIDDRTAKIHGLPNELREGLERLLRYGKDELETYDLFEENGFDEEATAAELDADR